MQEYTDHKNSEYGSISRSVEQIKLAFKTSVYLSRDVFLIEVMESRIWQNHQKNIKTAWIINN